MDRKDHGQGRDRTAGEVEEHVRSNRHKATWRSSDLDDRGQQWKEKTKEGGQDLGETREERKSDGHVSTTRPRKDLKSRQDGKDDRQQRQKYAATSERGAEKSRSRMPSVSRSIAASRDRSRDRGHATSRAPLRDKFSDRRRFSRSPGRTRDSEKRHVHHSEGRRRPGSPEHHHGRLQGTFGRTKRSTSPKPHSKSQTTVHRKRAESPRSNDRNDIVRKSKRQADKARDQHPHSEHEQDHSFSGGDRKKRRPGENDDRSRAKRSRTESDTRAVEERQGEKETVKRSRWADPVGQLKSTEAGGHSISESLSASLAGSSLSSIVTNMMLRDDAPNMQLPLELQMLKAKEKERRARQKRAQDELRQKRTVEPMSVDDLFEADFAMRPVAKRQTKDNNAGMPIENTANDLNDKRKAEDRVNRLRKQLDQIHKAIVQEDEVIQWYRGREADFESQNFPGDERTAAKQAILQTRRSLVEELIAADATFKPPPDYLAADKRQATSSNRASDEPAVMVETPSRNGTAARQEVTRNASADNESLPFSSATASLRDEGSESLSADAFRVTSCLAAVPAEKAPMSTGGTKAEEPEKRKGFVLIRRNLLPQRRAIFKPPPKTLGQEKKEEEESHIDATIVSAEKAPSQQPVESTLHIGA